MKAKRMEEIQELLHIQGEISMEELRAKFSHCSDATLRRDLQRLERDGLAKRTLGGAVAVDRLCGPANDIYFARSQENAVQKYEIAKKALQFLNRGRSIYIDAGTTMMFLAREMQDEYLSIMTSGINIAMELLKKQKPSITVIGGQINRNTIAMSGAHSASFLQNVNIDVAFIAASGYSIETGFTCGTYTECEVKKEVVNHARQKILLMDSHKVSIAKPFTFATMEDIDVLVTDSGIEPFVVSETKRKNVTLL